MAGRFVGFVAFGGGGHLPSMIAATWVPHSGQGQPDARTPGS
jgi:hypothetical protein